MAWIELVPYIPNLLLCVYECWRLLTCLLNAYGALAKRVGDLRLGGNSHKVARTSSVRAISRSSSKSLQRKEKGILLAAMCLLSVGKPFCRTFESASGKTFVEFVFGKRPNFR